MGYDKNLENIDLEWISRNELSEGSLISTLNNQDDEEPDWLDDVSNTESKSKEEIDWLDDVPNIESKSEEEIDWFDDVSNIESKSVEEETYARSRGF